MLALLWTCASWATPITYSFAGGIDIAEGEFLAFINQPVSGSFTYDTAWTAVGPPTPSRATYLNSTPFAQILFDVNGEMFDSVDFADPVVDASYSVTVQDDQTFGISNPGDLTFDEFSFFMNSVPTGESFLIGLSETVVIPAVPQAFDSLSLTQPLDLSLFNRPIGLHSTRTDDGSAQKGRFRFTIDSLQILSVPEPTTLSLIVLGLAGLGFTRRGFGVRRKASG